MCCLAAGMIRPGETAPPVPVTLLVTGGTLGYLEPCGCGGQRQGGIAGRIETIRSLREAHPDALLVDAGDAVDGIRRQDELKFQATAMALRRIGYDAIVPGERDLALDPAFLGSTLGALALPFVCANARPALPWARPYALCAPGGMRVAVVGIVDPTLVAACEGEDAIAFEAPPATLGRLAPEIERQADLVVLLAHVPAEKARGLAQAFTKPCAVIAGHPDQTAPRPPEAYPNAIIIDPGARGRYVTRVGVELGSDGSLARYTYRALPVTAPADPKAESLSPLRFYQSRLATEDLVGRVPQRLLPEGQAFVGAAACQPCHRAPTTAWEGSAHAKAYRTLTHIKHEADPECVVCHTVGFGFQSGFAGTPRTPGLANVGCESCHGPASRHVADPRVKPPADAAAACDACHTPEHSPAYDAAKHAAAIRH